MKRLIVPVIMLAAVAAFAQTRPPQRFSWTRPVAPTCGLSSTCRCEKSPWKPAVTKSVSVPMSSHGV